MRKIRIVVLGLFAVLALCAFAVPAFAESGWLVNGALTPTALPVEGEGLLVLRKFASSKSSTVLNEIHCEAIGDGTIQEKTDTVTDLLNIAMETIGVLNTEDEAKTALSCEVTFDEGALTDCKAGTLASVWVVGLNLQLGDVWLTEVLLNAGVFSDDLLGLNNLGEPAGIDVECESLIGVKGSEECTGSESSSMRATLTNVTTTTPPSVLGVGIALEIAERGNCTMTGEQSSDVTMAEGNVWGIGGTPAAPEELNRLETAVS